VLAELDFTFAKAKYAYTLDATLPEMTTFQPRKPDAQTGQAGGGYVSASRLRDRPAPGPPPAA
jgi:hypothetical protein